MNWKEPKVYAVKHKDNDVINNSRSGGIFTALSDVILDENGIVYGCVLEEDNLAYHFRATTKIERNRMRGSKYIQSDMGLMLENVKKDLKENKKVLFSGTSCQIAGLKAFLSKSYDNLFCVDIVCHGVPSPKVWKDYIMWQEKKQKGKCVSINFRNKKDYGWANHVESLQIKGKNGIIKQVDSKVFTKLFYNHAILRPSCYSCPYKDIMHPADISIADYWGIEKAAPEFNDNKGVSLVLINNEKGFDFFSTSLDKIIYKETRIEDSMQDPFIAPFHKPNNRSVFWNDYFNKTFDIIARKYADYGALNSMTKFIKKVVNKIKKVFKR